MTTAQKIAIADRLRPAVIEAMDEMATLGEMVIYLRLIQLKGQGAHPDDSFGWGHYGSDLAMLRLEAELHHNHNGMDVVYDQEARKLLAFMQLGQTTLDLIESGDDQWGRAIANAQQFRRQS